MTRPAIAAIERALWVLPENEHAAFGRAIAARAAEWTAAGATGRDTPAMCPIVVQVRPALNIVAGTDQEADGDPPDNAA